MSQVFLSLLFAGTLFSLISEIITVLFPDSLVQLVTEKPDTITFTGVHKLLAVLSIVYMINVGLLLFSSDPVFRVYAFVLIFLSMSVWVLKKFVNYFKYIMIAESTLCIVILIDILRTILTMYHILPLKGLL